MIILIKEKFHDYEEHEWYADTDKLDENNSIDMLIKQACQKDGFSQDVYIDVNKYRNKYPNDSVFWAEPETSDCGVKVSKSTKPEKLINLTIYFDC